MFQVIASAGVCGKRRGAPPGSVLPHSDPHLSLQSIQQDRTERLEILGNNICYPFMCTLGHKFMLIFQTRLISHRLVSDNTVQEHSVNYCQSQYRTKCLEITYFRAYNSETMQYKVSENLQPSEYIMIITWNNRDIHRGNIADTLVRKICKWKQIS